MSVIGFLRAATHTIHNFELGYVNDPDDPGGETNYGITKATAERYGYTGSMKDIDPATVVDIYWRGYWRENDLDAVEGISFSIAREVFDTGVNVGTRRAARFLQQSINIMNRRGTLFPDIAEDGVIGPLTIEALNRLSDEGDIETLYQSLNHRQGHYYASLARKNEKFERFYRGWLKRATFNEAVQLGWK